MKSRKTITIKSYNKTATEYTRLVDPLHPKKEFKTFVSLLPTKAKVLDLGWGLG